MFYLSDKNIVYIYLRYGWLSTKDETVIDPKLFNSFVMNVSIISFSIFRSILYNFVKKTTLLNKKLYNARQITY